ncbi:MAG: amidophosphoribosyltransferase [Desulfovibrio sp.]|nr:amidophosphoribosyltransferase [Desulfovibrio sp.]
MKRHYCGLMGIFDHEDAAKLVYFGLYAQQHRGQESAGIVTYDKDGLHEHRKLGLVHDVFSENDFQHLPGKIAIGHVRYSTTGISTTPSVPPFMAYYHGHSIVIAHNGNLVNTAELRSELEKKGSIFTSDNDTEVFLHLIVRELSGNSVHDAVKNACSHVKGAYSLLVLIDGTMIALRDPYGIRPLALGRLNGKPIFASETCAFDLLEAEYERTLEPGEMYIVDGDGEYSVKLLTALPKPKQCIFELVYFARPDSYVFNEQVYVCRKQMGWQLAHESPADVDFVLPFPDSGVYSAVGFAQCSELPYEHAMIRNHYVGRSFIQPSQNMRNFSARVKINPVKPMINGKKICIVDDSIVRGTTMITRVRKLRELGAKEVHIRISCPPIKHPCHYGIDFANPRELIAASNSVEEIRRILDVDSLHYLSVDGLLRSVMHSDEYCLACFTGDYPIECDHCIR